ncbi:MAG: hypothetical protein RL456_1958 [Pseudomonadota bacterium]|jgi:hypothetical protein
MTTADHAGLDLTSQPTPEQILAARQAAGHTQTQAAAAVGLSGGIRWSEYERHGPTGRRIDPARWQLYLLLTDQHTAWRLSRRRRPTQS